MRPRRQLRRIAKWTALATTASLAILWVFTTPVPFGNHGWIYVHPKHMASLVSGRLYWEWPSAASHVTGGFTVHARPLTWPFRESAIKQLGLLWPHVRWTHGKGLIVIPLWLPLLIVSGLTAFTWRNARRRPSAGHCSNCNYDLTANQSGKCPECGTPAPKSEPEARARACDTQPR